jgi:hypothetical protein
VIDELNVGFCCLDIFEMIVKTSERAWELVSREL